MLRVKSDAGDFQTALILREEMAAQLHEEQ